MVDGAVSAGPGPLTCRMSGSVRRWMGVGSRKPLRLMARRSQWLRPMDSVGRRKERGKAKGGEHAGGSSSHLHIQSVFGRPTAYLLTSSHRAPHRRYNPLDPSNLLTKRPGLLLLGRLLLGLEAAPRQRLFRRRVLPPKLDHLAARRVAVHVLLVPLLCLHDGVCMLLFTLSRMAAEGAARPSSGVAAGGRRKRRAAGGGAAADGGGGRSGARSCFAAA
jgi:hypothetical protein